MTDLLPDMAGTPKMQRDNSRCGCIGSNGCAGPVNFNDQAENRNLGGLYGLEVAFCKSPSLKLGKMTSPDSFQLSFSCLKDVDSRLPNGHLPSVRRWHFAASNRLPL